LRYAGFSVATPGKIPGSGLVYEAVSFAAGHLLPLGPDRHKKKMLWIQLRKLRGADSAARVAAAHVLAERGNRKAVEPLGVALEDRAWAERSAAAVALGKIGSGRAQPFLTAALADDPEVDVRCSAAWALGRIGGKAAIAPLAGALSDADDSVRRVAVEALTKIGTALALEGLTRALSDGHHDVRLAAVKGLGAIGGATTAADLLHALGDQEWSVRLAAAESVAKLEDSTAVPVLVAALRGERLAARIAAAEALGRIGDPRAAEALIESVPAGGELSECDLRVRRNVAKALGDIGKAAALPTLEALAADVYSAGIAVESMAKVMRWDAAGVESVDLQRLAELEDVQQVPWMIEEAVEESTGRVVVRQGRPWTVDATDLRALALAELRRREKDQ